MLLPPCLTVGVGCLCWSALTSLQPRTFDFCLVCPHKTLLQEFCGALKSSFTNFKYAADLVFGNQPSSNTIQCIYPYDRHMNTTLGICWSVHVLVLPMGLGVLFGFVSNFSSLHVLLFMWSKPDVNSLKLLFFFAWFTPNSLFIFVKKISLCD